MEQVTRRDALRLASAVVALGVERGPPRAAAQARPARPAEGPEVFDLAFRGGGVKGAALIGALKVLTEHAGKPRVRRLIGTSAGAVFATCFAAGYTPDRMLKELEPVADPDDPTRKKPPFALFTATPAPADEKVVPLPAGNLERTALGLKLLKAVQDKRYGDLVTELLRYTPLQTLLSPLLGRVLEKTLKLDADQSNVLAGKSVALLKEGTACDDRHFRKWLDGLLSDRDVHKDLSPTLTLAEFHEKISGPRDQQLSLIATDTTDQQLLVLNHRTAPKLPLREAVRMSMGIPFVWPEVKWDRAWGRYKFWKPAAEGAADREHLIVDGGVLSNFPLRYLLDDVYAQPGSVLGPPPGLPVGVQEADVRKVGLFLNNALPEDAPAKPEAWYEGLPAFRTAARVLDTMMDSWDQEALRQFPGEKRARVVCDIGTKGYGSLDFDLSGERLAELVKRGGDAMAAFLKR